MTVAVVLLAAATVALALWCLALHRTLNAVLVAIQSEEPQPSYQQPDYSEHVAIPLRPPLLHDQSPMTVGTWADDDCDDLRLAYHPHGYL